MREVEIGKNDAGQRLDKFLRRYLREANDGFLYKMLRKKNILLNGSRAAGREIVQEHDVVTLYLSDETMAKFGGGEESCETKAPCRQEVNNREAWEWSVLYEDADILVLDKPQGVLSQKAHPEDISLNEQMLAYLCERGEWRETDRFTPSVVNRLDRNTSGIVLAGKSLAGSQILSKLLREHRIEKYYYALIHGDWQAVYGDKSLEFTSYMKKDRQRNRMSVYDSPVDGSSETKTRIRFVDSATQTRCEPESKRQEGSDPVSLVEVELITGKTHQIRAQMAKLGFALVGDKKYEEKTGKAVRPGRPNTDRDRRNGENAGIYLLHAYRVKFPGDIGLDCAGKQIICPLPAYFSEKISSYGIKWEERWEHGIPEA